MTEPVDRGSRPEAPPAPNEAGQEAGTGDPAEVDPGLVASLQALLFISDVGLDDGRLAAAVDRTLETTRTALAALQARLDEPGSGIVLREHASGWRLTTAPACAPVLERFVIDGHSSRLSPAALETLAVVAYQQPVSRGRIAAIRGVAVDGVIRTLVARGLVEEAGVEPSGALLYATTSLFMDKLGIKSLTELPALAPLLPDIETLDGFEDRPNLVTSAPNGGIHTAGTATAEPTSGGRPFMYGDPPPVLPVPADHPDHPADAAAPGGQPDPNGDADGDDRA